MSERMQPRGLLSRLAGVDPSRPIDVPVSILSNLRVLLNGRLGQSLASEGFGITDLSDIVHEFPDALQVMRREIRTTVERYEPRLASVRVLHVPGPDPLCMTFEITARLKARGEMVRVQTQVRADGRVEVD